MGRGSKRMSAVAAKAWRVRVDTGICQGHSVCMAEAPEIFEVEDVGEFYPIARVLQARIGEDLIEQARTAERYCPNRAIKVEEIAEDGEIEKPKEEEKP